VSNSTRKPRKRKSDKPEKPRPDFPLFPHATKRWAKKIRGKMHYFGPWADPDGALAKYQEQKDDLHAGRTPRADLTGLTVADLCNYFLTSKRHLLDTGELAMSSWRDYYAVCERLTKELSKTRLVDDLRPVDFEKLRASLAKTWGPVRLGNEINRVRTVFNYGLRNGHIEKPVLFGDMFKRPNKKTLRKARAQKGPRMFEAPELLKIIGAASQPLKTMFLLAINCGFGNSDCGNLPMSAVNLETGWIDFPRPKTGIPRRCPLWLETIAAIREWLAVRPKPALAEHAGLLFLTCRGDTWAKQGYLDENGKPKNAYDNPVSKETTKLLKELGINGHRNFYAARHTFQTMAEDRCGHFPAIRAIMGHADSSISDHYRERVSDERLRAVVDAVHEWLFAERKRGGTR
jgi:integrase